MFLKILLVVICIHYFKQKKNNKNPFKKRIKVYKKLHLFLEFDYMDIVCKCIMLYFKLPDVFILLYLNG